MSEAKILLLFSSSALGGAERSLTRMALENNSAETGVRIELASLGGDGPWADWVQSQGHVPVLLGKAQRGRLNIATLVRLVRQVRANDYSVIYVIGWRAAMALRFLCPLVSKAKVVQGVRWNPSGTTRLDRFFRFGERYFGRLVYAYIVNSQVTRHTLVDGLGIPSDKVKLIYNGLESRDQPKPYQQRAPIVLTVANFIPSKGHLAFLTAIAEVVREVPHARFVFVGRDEMNGQVQRQILEMGLQKWVDVAGFQPDVEHYYAQARLFAFPSLKEGAPTSVLEAMRAGVPVVAFAIDGIPELVEDGDQGILVKPGDMQAMAKAIVSLLKSEDVAERMGAAGRRRTEVEFSLRHCATRHAEVFRELLGLSRKNSVRTSV